MKAGSQGAEVRSGWTGMFFFPIALFMFGLEVKATPLVVFVVATKFFWTKPNVPNLGLFSERSK